MQAGKNRCRSDKRKLEDRESENICKIEEEKEWPGTLYIEDGTEKERYYCDSLGQYWDEITNKKLDNQLVEAARLDAMKGLYQHGVYEKVNIEECWERTGKAPSRRRWLDMNKVDKMR